MVRHVEFYDIGKVFELHFLIQSMSKFNKKNSSTLQFKDKIIWNFLMLYKRIFPLTQVIMTALKKTEQLVRSFGIKNE